MRLPKIASLPPVQTIVRSRSGASFLKFLLPTLAMIVVSAVVLWPQLLRNFYAVTSSPILLKLQGDVAINAAINPVYHGIDHAGQPYTLKAVHGKEVAPHIYVLENPFLVYHLHSGKVVNVAAQVGTYHYKEQKVYLQKGVHLQHSLGYDFKTTRAVIDVQKGTITGDDFVKGHAPTGKIESLGFQIIEKGDRILLGKSKVQHQMGGKE